MIGKLSATRLKSADKLTRIASLVNYVAAPEAAGVEKCTHLGSMNFLSTDVTGMIAEMQALAAASVRSKDPIAHFIFAWPPGERPSKEQVDEAAMLALGMMAMSEHQAIWGLHQDKDHLHFHLVINRISPETEKSIEINKGFTREIAHQVVAAIEARQGWSSKENARYVLENDILVRVAEIGDKPSISAPAQAVEARSGEMSVQRFAQERCPDLANIGSWAALHEALSNAGMRIERKGSGAMNFVDDLEQAVKASSVDRRLSFSKLEKKLGPFEPSGHDATRVVSPLKPADIGPTVPGGIQLENRMRPMSESYLAPTTDADGPCAILLDSEPDRPNPDGLRRSGAVAAAVRGTGRPVEPEPNCWNIYKTERDAALETRRTSKLAVQTEIESQRQAMAARHKQATEAFFNANWKGRTRAKRIARSLLAYHRSRDLAAFKDETMRLRASVRTASFPAYADWLAARFPEKAQAFKARTGGVVATLTYTDPNPTPPAASEVVVSLGDIRIFKPRPNAETGVVTYARPWRLGSFRDEGQRIVVMAKRDDTALLAVLQLAASRGRYVHVDVPLWGRKDFLRRVENLASAYKIPIYDEELKRRTEEQVKKDAEAAVRKKEIAFQFRQIRFAAWAMKCAVDKLIKGNAERLSGLGDRLEQVGRALHQRVEVDRKERRLELAKNFDPRAVPPDLLQKASDYCSAKRSPKNYELGVVECFRTQIPVGIADSIDAALEFNSPPNITRRLDDLARAELERQIVAEREAGRALDRIKSQKRQEETQRKAEERQRKENVEPVARTEYTISAVGVAMGTVDSEYVPRPITKEAFSRLSHEEQLLVYVGAVGLQLGPESLNLKKILSAEAGAMLNRAAWLVDRDRQQFEVELAITKAAPKTGYPYALARKCADAGAVSVAQMVRDIATELSQGKGIGG